MPSPGLEPAPFWRHFAALTRIPRPSYEEAAAAAHVQAWAEAPALQTRRDAAGNLVVAVPATPGREAAPTVILQGHLDMVCERDPDSAVRPAHRPGRACCATATGCAPTARRSAPTTASRSPRCSRSRRTRTRAHGPLELLMTVEEEVGLGGAFRLDPVLISGSVLLNLDSEEDGSSPSAARAAPTRWCGSTRRASPPPGTPLRVTVSGALGGHSGGDIALGRAERDQAARRACCATCPGLRIASLDGGASRNAIPRDATAVIVVDGRRAPPGRIEADGVHARRRLPHDRPRRADRRRAPTEAADGAWTRRRTARAILDLVAAPCPPARSA